MAAMLYGIAILTTLFETVATSDMHCTSFQRQPLHVGEGPTRLSCPGPRCTHAPSGNFTRKVAAPSAVMCGLICMRDGGCESFRYCQEQNLCQLNTTLPDVAMKTLRATRCVLFDQEIQEETKEVADASISTSVALPCHWNRTTAIEEYVEIPSALSAPLRIKFKVYLSRHWADLIFSANTSENKVYKVAINTGKFYVAVMEDNNWIEKPDVSGSFVGSIFVITINGGHIIVDVLTGENFDYQYPSRPDVTNWYVSFGGDKSEIQWNFFDPCNPF